MIVKNGILTYVKEANIGTNMATRLVVVMDVYEKIVGNYKEYVIKITSYRDISLDENGNETYVYEGLPTEYKVIPNATFEKVANTFELSYNESYFTWTTSLTQIS